MNASLSISIAIFLAVSALVWVLSIFGSQTTLAYKRSFIHAASFNLEELFFFVDPKRLFYLNVGLIFIVFMFTWLVSGYLLIALIASVLTGILPRFLYRWLKARRLEKIVLQLPDALMMISGSLRAGANLTGAMVSIVNEQPAPLSQEFDLTLREHRLGVTLDDALQHMGVRVPCDDFELVLSATRIAREVGGNLAETLERLAETLRQKQAMEGKIRALTAQGKLQGYVVGLLPFVLAYVLYKMDPDTMSLLFTTRIGWAVTGVIVLMEIMGMYVIRKITNIDV